MLDDTDGVELAAARAALPGAVVAADQVRALSEGLATQLRDLDRDLTESEAPPPREADEHRSRAAQTAAAHRAVRAQLDVIGERTHVLAARVRALRDGDAAAAPARPDTPAQPDPGASDPVVAERVLGTEVTAAVPRLGEKAPAAPVWPPIPVPRWCDVAGSRSTGTTATVVAGVTAGATESARTETAVTTLAQRSRGTRRTLLLAAAHRFAALGYHGTSLADILAEAGADRGESITKGALYFHFSSKHDLAQCLVDETVTSWAGVVDAVAAQELDPLRSILATFDAAVAMSMHDPVTRGARRIRADHASFADVFAVAECTELERVARLLHVARDGRLLRTPADPTWTADHVYTVFAGHRARSEDVAGRRPDLWTLMTATWQAVLPAVASEDWLRGWRVSGWARRPRPDPEAYRRARRADPG